MKYFSTLVMLSMSLAAFGCSSSDNGHTGPWPDGGNGATGGSAAGGSGAIGGGAGNGGSGAMGGTGATGGSATGGTGATGTGGSGATPANEPPGLEGITQAHNEARAAENAGLPPLVWDPELAAVAQAWVDQCTNVDQYPQLLDHNDGRSDTYPGYVGENIYASSGTPSPTQAVSRWMGEKQYYDFSTGSCASGQACGHYTQVVWKETTKLGCGIGNCPNIPYPGTIVCDYAPGGNTGGTPY